MDNRWKRRAISIPTMLLIGFVSWLGGPALLPLFLLVGLVRRKRFVLVRVLAIGAVYSCLSSLGLIGLFFLTFVPKTSPRYQKLHYDLQLFWARSLFAWIRSLMSLEIRAEGAELVQEGPLLVFSRHTSLIDTLLPILFMSRVRYVLKRELVKDPCLDVVGHRLPNYFVDRASSSAGASGDEALDKIAELAKTMGPTDATLIYPEGTRFSESKRKRILASLRQKGSEFATRAEALENTLPPKKGGVLAMLRGNASADCVFLVHRGLESFATVKDILAGELVGTQIVVEFLRVPRSEVPPSESAQIEWLWTWWAEVDRRSKLA